MLRTECYLLIINSITITEPFVHIGSLIIGQTSISYLQFKIYQGDGDLCLPVKAVISAIKAAEIYRKGIPHNTIYSSGKGALIFPFLL